MASVDVTICISQFSHGAVVGVAVAVIAWFSAYAFSVMFKIFKNL